MFNRLLFIFFICCYGLHAFAQSVNMDSLKHLLPLLQGTQKADLLNAISKAYRPNNFDSSAGYANAANNFSQNIGYPRGIGESNRNLGLIQPDPRKAREYLYKALWQFKSIHDNRGLADTYNNLGSFFSESNDSLALSCYDSALILFRVLGYKEGEGAVLNYIGMVYQGMGNFQKAIDFTLQGLEVRKKTNDYPGVIYSLINAGHMYLDGGQLESALKLYLESVSYATDHGIEPYNYSLKQIGKTYLLLKQYDKAEKYLIRPDGKSGTTGQDPLLLGQLYSETDRPESALKEFKISLDNGRKDNNKEVTAASLIGLSRVYASEKQQKLALGYARQAYNLSDSLKNKRFLAEAANLLEPTYEKAGDFRKSLYLFKQAHFILDSISTETSENFQHKLAFFESKSEIEKEQAHVQILSAEKALQDQKLNDEKHYKEMILAGTAIILLISFLTIRNINQKRKKIQSQKDQIDIQKAKVEEAYEELKITQAQLIHREKMASLGELMAGIAHEIQNPLNFVNNFSEVNGELILEMEEAVDKEDLAEVRNLSANIKKNIEKITHHGKRADSIVKGMLQHSRSSSGQKEQSDINALTDEFLRLSYESAKVKDKTFHATINTYFDQSLSKINLIPQDIGRVLLNLFNNAFYSVNEKMKLSGPEYKPEVSASTRKLPKSVELRVRDNGMGISQKVLDKIYNPFFTTKPTGQGTGLGLSLSYDIIAKLHGGSLQAETKEGEYAEFIIQLPV
jgi:two-component system, NtrC family, sensor kinase